MSFEAPPDDQSAQATGVVNRFQNVPLRRVPANTRILIGSCPLCRCGACSVRADRRRHALLRRLLERVRELDQPRLAARHAGEADAEAARLRVEAGRERRRRRVRHHAERHDHRRIAGPRGDGRRRSAPGNSIASRPFGFHHLVDAVRRRRARCPWRDRPRSARDPPRRSISSEMSSCDWPYLIAPAFVCAMFHSRSSVSVFTGAAGAERWPATC